MNDPKISFVIPSKDRVAWLPECLSGLQAQTVKEIEIVVVNDGSTDGTKELLDNWYSKDKRIKIIHNPENRGAGISRNIGNNAAQAEIIGVCDSDDCYPIGRAEEILKFFEKYPKGIMMNAPYVRIDYCLKILRRFEGEEFDEKRFKKDGYVNYFCHPSAAYTRQDIFDIGGYKPETKLKTDDLQLVEDWIKAGKKIGFAPEHYLCMHRVLPGSIMANMRGFQPEWTGGKGYI